MTPDPLPLLADLVRAESLSAREGPAADALERWLASHGVTTTRIGHDVICEKGSGERGLLFNSHLDTVPVAPGWTRDPFGAAVEGERLYGLGSTDAKSCVAAMAAAFVALPDPGPRGRIVLAATAEEETGGRGAGGSGRSGMEARIEGLLPLAGAVVGEPTSLQVAVGQRGMLKLLLRAEGRAGHASRPWEGVNAIERMAIDLLALRALAADAARSGADPLLGPPTLQATTIEGGTATNVIPARCEVVLDGRTTPRYDNALAIERVRQRVSSVVEVRSDRYLPVRVAVQDPIVRAAQAALPSARLVGFGGVSDLFFVARAGVPGVLIGPGSGTESHQPDEFVSIPRVREGARAYLALAEAFLR